MIALLLWACAGDDGPSDGTQPPTDTDEPSSTATTGSDTTDTVGTQPPSTGRVVVLAIGDGMGFEHMVAGSLYATGQPEGLGIQSLPISGTVRTASFDGIADSASAGTALACGVHTYNSAIGQDRDGLDVENLVEVARAAGWATGVVTTSELPHATPAVFTAHHDERDEEVQIAGKQVVGAADVMLGGGQDFYVDLQDEIAAGGWTWVDTTEALAASDATRIWGAFAAKHLPYVTDGIPDPGLPTLVVDALARLEGDPEGMFLMIEGARIDHASHGNAADKMVAEVQAFDQAIGEVLAWADASGRDLTLLVTSDHECGGLDVLSGAAAGQVPDVSWRWGSHTNADVPILAQGSAAEGFDGALVDQREIHARLVEWIAGTYTPAPDELLPDGRHDDLPFRAVDQTATSSLGDDVGRLQALVLGADDRGLAIGIEGLFPWQTSTLVLAIDVDYGQGTGATSLLGLTSGATTPAEAVVDNLRIDTLPAGMAADLVLVSVGGAETPYVAPQRGLFGLRSPWGAVDDVLPVRVAMNYGPDTRTRPDRPGSVVTNGVGFETLIVWSDLFPSLGGRVPPMTRVAVVAVLVSADGTQTTNQLLPPLPPGAPAPGALPISPPGAVLFPIDPDGDGVPNPAAPSLLP